MKLFATSQIAEIDKYTIENEPVAEIELMERAAQQVTDWIVGHYDRHKKLIVFAGPGNNGGDALAVARQCSKKGFNAEVYIVNSGRALTGTSAINRNRLEKCNTVTYSFLINYNEFPEVNPSDVIIDGLFGSGLSRPLTDLFAAIVQKINNLPNEVVAIDIPSGLMGGDNSANDPENIIRACYTLTFQFPKISFLFAENHQFTGQWYVLPIGLHHDAIENIPSPYHLTEKEDVKPLLPVRNKFDHKGTYGHALLIAGSYGKMGASVLASRACLRAGVGLLTTHVPHFGYPVIQTAVPEAMASIDEHDSIVTRFPDLQSFTAVGAGPGIGIKSNTCKAIGELISKSLNPLVLDADALNILALKPEWLKKLPPMSILTPHPGEFRRLAGETSNSWQQLQEQLQLAQKLNAVIVVKGAHTSVALPDGKIYFNSSGNPGMATAGSGDVLTGIILGLLAQHMSPAHAAVTGVYLHGRAGDLAAQSKSMNALMAGDIIDALGMAFIELSH